VQAVRSPSRIEATYVDTSVWCACCFNQEESPQAGAWLRDADLMRLGSAWWTQTEFASALAIQLRKKALTPPQARWAQASFADWMGAVNRLDVIEDDFLQAAAWVSKASSGLRGGDALHLAVAQRHGCKAVASLDVVMQRSALSFGFEVVNF
jgi:predicted nucleic acid-binding protein